MESLEIGTEVVLKSREQGLFSCFALLALNFSLKI